MPLPAGIGTSQWRLGTDGRSDGAATEKRIPRGIFRRMCCGQQNGLHCPRDIKKRENMRYISELVNDGVCSQGAI